MRFTSWARYPGRSQRGGCRWQISIAPVWICSDTNSSSPRPRWSNSAPCSARHHPNRCRSPVAVVLVEPMLWARFEPTADGLRTIVHVSGAERGDLVVVTGEAVIAEIAARRLTFRQAYERGVARLYGDEPRSPRCSNSPTRSARARPHSAPSCAPKRAGGLGAEAHLSLPPAAEPGAALQTSEKLIQ